jgi:hypothetical protein
MLPVSDMRQVHEWFLHRGLPLVLTRRVRSRALIERSAPMVSGVGAVISLTMMLAELTDGDPNFGYAIRLGVLTLLLIAAPFALYLLHQSGTTLGEAGRGSAALLVMALFVLGLPFAASGFSGIAAAEAFGLAIAAVLAIWLTYVGFGSIALWAFRFAWVQLGALGTLMSRALPLLMITVVVYFTGELWQLAARMTRQRLWQTIGFLAAVADRIRDHHNSRRGARTAGRSRRAVGSRQAARGHTLGNPARPPAGAHTTVTGRTGQRRRGHGGVTGDSGGVLHRRAIRVLPGTRHRRGARRCGRAVVRRRNLPSR